MTLRQLFSFLFFVFTCTLFYGQGEANYWYFGNNAGINFNTTPPTALTDGKLSTTEGCSTMSDASGNLLFYSDGRTVWNRNHEIMPNANYFGGNGLFGDPSSTSSALIVPKPGDPNLYYIFTIDEPHHDNAAAYPNMGPANTDGTPTEDGFYTDRNEGIPLTDDGFNNGFNYSLVDMRLEGGLGDVVSGEKNVPLITYDPLDPEQVKYKCSEKITAVRADVCDAFWIISHFIDSFYAFKIDATGVNKNPVISQVGPTAPITSYRRAGLGYLKASPDGTKLAIAHNTFDFDPTEIIDEGFGGIYLHDFDDITGRVTSSLELTNTVNPYSLEFSAETKKVYASAKAEIFGNKLSQILQWNLESTDIPNSVVTIHQSTEGNEFIGALQLASDSKIYVSISGNSDLAVINKPEANGGAVDYSETVAGGAINLKGKQASIGLPPFIQSIFSKLIGIVDPKDSSLSSLQLCEGDNARLASDDIPGATYTWSKGTQELPDTTYFLDIKEPGEYKLEIDLNDGSCPLKGIANVTIAPLPDIAASTLTQCNFEGISENIFDLEKAIPNLTKNNEQLEVSFHISPMDAELDQNELQSSTYRSTETTTKLYARVENKQTSCSAVTTLDLAINNNTVNKVILENCDDAGADGIADFNLANARNKILDGIIVTNPVITYYLNVSDAVLTKRPITSTNVTNAVPITNAYYARVEDASKNCFGISEIKLLVKAVPALEEDLSINYCVDLGEPVTINAGELEESQENYTFSWSPSGENSYEIQTTNTTTHTVAVTNKTTGCENYRAITLIPSETPLITNVIIEGHTRNTKAIIVTTGGGDYEYAIDDPNGDYQDAPVFLNLEIGNHIAYARDKNGCGDAIPREFPVLGFPEFFSPNSDGQNDFWQVEGFQEIDKKQAKISIFDRFGKLIKSISPSSRGWNGNYNGKALPQSDYWVRVELSSGIVLNSHFSLLR